ncbi:Protein F54F2.7 [Aphelenchoides avenae]|nr:Protein F54F2.7 [Aphelenchus avenae]
MPETRICVIRCKDGSIHPIRSGIRATLIEVNERLKEQPTLVQTAGERYGYLAIVLPSVVNSDVTRTPKEFAQDEEEDSEPPTKRSVAKPDTR